MRRGRRGTEGMACAEVEAGTWRGRQTECRNEGSRVAVECCSDNGAGFDECHQNYMTALSGIITTEWNWHTDSGMEVPCLYGAERADRNGSVHQPRSGTADGTAFQDGREKPVAGSGLLVIVFFLLLLLLLFQSLVVFLFGEEEYRNYNQDTTNNR